jgi:hypothetical protein
VEAGDFAEANRIHDQIMLGDHGAVAVDPPDDRPMPFSLESSPDRWSSPAEAERFRKAVLDVRDAEHRVIEAGRADPRGMEPDWYGGHASTEDLEEWAATLNGRADQRETQAEPDRTEVADTRAAGEAAKAQRAPAALPWLHVDEPRSDSREQASTTGPDDVVAATTDHAEVAQAHELAQWAPHDLDRWLADQADDPTVTDIEYRDAQAAVHSALVGELDAIQDGYEDTAEPNVEPAYDWADRHPELDSVEAAIHSLDQEEPITEESLNAVGVTAEQYQDLLDDLDAFTEAAASRAEQHQALVGELDAIQDGYEDTAEPSVEPAGDDWDEALRQLGTEEVEPWMQARDAATWSAEASENAYDQVLDDPSGLVDPPQPWFDPDRAWSDPVDPVRGLMVDEEFIADGRDRVFSALTGLDPTEHDTRELSDTVRGDWVEDWTPAEMREYYRRDDDPVNRLGTQHETDADLIDDAAVDALIAANPAEIDDDELGEADGLDQDSDPVLREGPASSGYDCFGQPLSGSAADEITTQKPIARTTSQTPLDCCIHTLPEDERDEAARAKQLNHWHAEDQARGADQTHVAEDE